MTTPNLREQILSMNDLPREAVPVPEWGMTLQVRTLSGTERDAFEASILDANGKQTLRNIRAKLLVRCLEDDAGERVFGDADVDALGATSGAALDRLFTAAARLSGLSRKDVEELAKNSGTGPGAGSTSA